MEPPSADPHARWCGEGARQRASLPDFPAICDGGDGKQCFAPNTLYRMIDPSGKTHKRGRPILKVQSQSIKFLFSETCVFDRLTERNTIAPISETSPPRPKAIPCPVGSPGPRMIGARAIDPTRAPTNVGIKSERRLVLTFGFTPTSCWVELLCGGSYGFTILQPSGNDQHHRVPASDADSSGINRRGLRCMGLLRAVHTLLRKVVPECPSFLAAINCNVDVRSGRSSPVVFIQYRDR